MFVRISILLVTQLISCVTLMQCIMFATRISDTNQTKFNRFKIIKFIV